MTDEDKERVEALHELRNLLSDIENDTSADHFATHNINNKNNSDNNIIMIMY